MQEDQHYKLREKYKSLKTSLKKSSMERKEDKKMAGHAKAASELKHALKVLICLCCAIAA